MLLPLRAAQLIDVDDKESVPCLARVRHTPLLESLQTCLGLSLTALLDTHNPSLLRVAPFHGVPEERTRAADVFILCPFNEQMDDLCANVLRPSVLQLGLTSARADDFSTTTSVMKDIWKGIISAQAVIADCTGRNANVFYEIGLCHALGKPTILLTQNIDEMPFDLRDVRTIVYEYTPPGVRKLESALVRTLTAVLPMSRRAASTAAAASVTAQVVADHVSKRLRNARESRALLKTLSELGLIAEQRSEIDSAVAEPPEPSGAPK